MTATKKELRDAKWQGAMVATAMCLVASFAGGVIRGLNRTEPPTEGAPQKCLNAPTVVVELQPK